jgi:hypothetical protein
VLHYKEDPEDIAKLLRSGGTQHFSGKPDVPFANVDVGPDTSSFPRRSVNGARREYITPTIAQSTPMFPFPQGRAVGSMRASSDARTHRWLVTEVENGGKHSAEFGLLFHQTHGVPSTWVLLANQSPVDVICNGSCFGKHPCSLNPYGFELHPESYGSSSLCFSC